MIHSCGLTSFKNLISKLPKQSPDMGDVSARIVSVPVCRYEASAPRLDVLKDLDAYTIGLDRPA